LYNRPAVGGNSLGSSLTDDHPVNFLYDTALAAADGELVIPDSLSSVDAAGRLRLFGGTLQCATCHHPHDDSNGKFLVMSNDRSALCLKCHTK
jgi:predicted CXXCH cytochrome family protein